MQVDFRVYLITDRRQAPGGDILRAVEGALDRITSYNVCYTKLLRAHHERGDKSQRHQAPQRRQQEPARARAGCFPGEGGGRRHRRAPPARRAGRQAARRATASAICGMAQAHR